MCYLCHLKVSEFVKNHTFFSSILAKIVAIYLDNYTIFKFLIDILNMHIINRPCIP